MQITKNLIAQVNDQEVSLFTLSNSNGMQVQITNYGCTIVSIKFPDQSNCLRECVLGFDDFSNYLSEEYNQDFPHMGGLVGRYANRISQGKFFIEGVQYSLPVNNGPNHLHGGEKGFDRVVWNAWVEDTKLKLQYLSLDGEEGYPGNLHCEVCYSLTEENQLFQWIQATTDKPTVVNLVNHTYFNLAHGISQDCLDHELYIPSDFYVEVNQDLIPTGNLVSVHSSCMDFSYSHSIRQSITSGYDHTYVLRKDLENPGIKLGAKVIDKASGRQLEVHTTEPGIHLYTGNYLNNLKGHDNQVYKKHYGFCLETQKFPDSPNRPEFPSCFLDPDSVYSSTTVFSFSVI